ncbi:hypothetical protein M0813_21260 [Anaeramoeba flamelloides]|uniref:FPL domain-containing protein n=1 Tax=Anaeramoeba flamelloides TaxID=1746091 RepID=A0ABQ8YHG2_9EUKA|nr:hypothetical protein M0813_21260 [Anaeramoeba flamelloides]
MFDTEKCYLNGIIIDNETITELNSKLLVETLREISELMIWGDQHNERFFDWFLEKNIIGWFLKFLAQNSPTSIKIQLLQTLSIMIENIKSEKSIYFLLSNNHINSIITHQFDFSNDEVLAYYISFLKALSLKVNNKTIKLFYNLNTNEMPLYSESINFFNHPEGMIRIAVRTITLNVFRVDFKPSRELILNAKKIPYFINLVWFIRTNCLLIEEELQAKIINPKCLDDKLFAQLDDFYYLEDIFNLQISELNSTLSNNLRKNLFVPLFIKSFIDDPIEKNQPLMISEFEYLKKKKTSKKPVSDKKIIVSHENKTTTKHKLSGEIEIPKKLKNKKKNISTALDNNQQNKLSQIKPKNKPEYDSTLNKEFDWNDSNYFDFTDNGITEPEKKKISNYCSQILSLCLLSQIFHVINCSEIIVPLLTILLNPESDLEKVLEQNDMETEETNKRTKVNKMINKKDPLFQITLSGNDIFDEQKNDKDLKTSILIIDFSHELINNILSNVIDKGGKTINKNKKNNKNKNNKDKVNSKKKNNSNSNKNNNKKPKKNKKYESLIFKNENVENKSEMDLFIQEIESVNEKEKEKETENENENEEENINIIRSKIISFFDDPNERIVFFTLCFFYSICKQKKNSKPLLECIDVFPAKYRGSQKLLEELSVFDEEFEIKTKLINPPKHQFSLFTFNSPKKKCRKNNNQENNNNEANPEYSFWIVEKILNIFLKKQYYCFVTLQVCIKLLLELVYDYHKSHPYLTKKHSKLLDQAYLLSIKKVQHYIEKNPIGNLFMDLFQDEYEKSLRYFINFEKIISDPDLLIDIPKSPFSGVDLSKRRASGDVEQTLKNFQVFFMLRRLRNNLLGKKETNLPLKEPENKSTFKISQKIESTQKNIIPCYVNQTQRLQKVSQKYLMVENSHFLLLKPNQLDHGKTAVIKYKWDVRNIEFTQVGNKIIKFRILKGGKRLIKNNSKLETKRLVQSEFLLYFGKKIHYNATKREINEELNLIHSKKLALLKNLLGSEMKKLTLKFSSSKKIDFN